MSKENVNGHIGLGNAKKKPIQSEHSSSYTISKTRSNEEQKKLTKDKNSDNSELTQVTPNTGLKNMSNMKRKQVIDCELPCKITKVKDEAFSIPDIIDLTDDSNSNDRFDYDSDSSNSDDEMVEFKIELPKKRFMQNFESIYKMVRNMSGRDVKLNELFCKKRKKVKNRKKNKRSEGRKVQFTSIGNKSNSANTVESKRERVEEPESERKPVLLEFSKIKEQTVSSHCNFETSSIENLDSTMNSSSLIRYEDMDNGDLDYLEETMDLPSLKEFNSQIPMESNDNCLRPNVQITSKLTMQLSNNTEVEQWIKYEPECNISNDDELNYNATIDFSNVPLPETMKHESLLEDPTITNSKLDHVALNENATINTNLINSESAIIKNKPVQEDPTIRNSKLAPVALNENAIINTNLIDSESAIIKNEPVQEDPKIVNSKLAPIALNENATINTNLIDSEPAIIKNKPVQEDPKIVNSKLDPVVLNENATINTNLIDSESAIIKNKTVQEDPKITNWKLAPVALNENATINTTLINSEPEIKKRISIEDEPKQENSKFDIIILSDEDEDDKESIIDVRCKTEIKSEQIEDNSGKTLDDCNDFSKDLVALDSSDDDMEYHESQRNKLLEEIHKLSNTIEEMRKQVGDNNFEDDSQNTSMKDISKKRHLSSDDSNNAKKYKTSKEKCEIKREPSDNDEKMEKINEEAIYKDFQENQNNGDNVMMDAISHEHKFKVNKYRDKKESRNKIEDLDKKRSHDEKMSPDVRKIYGKQTSSDKLRSSYEKASHERSQVEKRSNEVKKCSDEQRSMEENIYSRVKTEQLEKVVESEDEAIKKSEHKSKIQKYDAVKRRHSSEGKTVRISNSNNNNSNVNLSDADIAVDSRQMPKEFPMVVMTELKDCMDGSTIPILAMDERNIKKIDESSNKQETSIAFTNNIESHESNEREIPSIKEGKNSASESTMKLNRELMLKCKTETKHRLNKDNQKRKSTDSASLRGVKTARLKGEALKEAVKKIALKEVKKMAEKEVTKTEKFSEYNRSSMELLTAKLEVKMMVEAGGHCVIKEQDSLIDKETDESQRISLMNEQYEQQENVGEFSEGKKRKDKSLDLVKEITVNKDASPVYQDKISKEKAEMSKILDVDSKENSIDGKVSPANGDNFFKTKEELLKCLDLATESFSKAETSTDRVGNSVEKSLPIKTNYCFDIERKSVASFVGRIPKKSATQASVSKISRTSNDYNHDIVGSNGERSPMDEKERMEIIWKSVATMVQEGQKQKRSKAPRNPFVSNNAVDKKTCPKMEQFLLRIFQWNPAWLKGTSYLNTPRKIVDDETLGPMRPIYESYEDYYSDAERLLALDIWYAIRSKREIDAMKAKHCVKFSIVKRSIILAKVLSTNIEMTTLLLDVVVSKREAMTQAHPVTGDLVFIKYCSKSQGNQYFTENEVFAYVTDVRSNIISPDTRYNRELDAYTDKRHTLLTYTVITKPIYYSEIQHNKVCDMTTIPYFRPNMRSILALQHLPDSLLLNMIFNPKVEDYQLPPAKNLENYPLVTEDELNSKQLEAVARITHTVVQRVPKICLIQGPPGTGKTKVIVNLLTQIIHGAGRYEKKPVFRILVCAPSNSAVDEIVMRLLEQRRMFEKGQRFKMVRVGRPDMMHQNVKQVSLTELATKEVHRMIETFRSYSTEKAESAKSFYATQITLLGLEKDKAKSADARKEIERKIEDVRSKYDFLVKLQTTDRLDRKEIDALHKAAENTLLEGAHVIACTLVSCCSSYMEEIFAHSESNAISVCIVDEATQSSESNTLLPLLLGVKTLILVGDTHQKPIPMSSKKKSRDLNQSLFARVQQAFAGQAINPTIQFDIQYRMSHPVAHWPKHHFYGGTLSCVADLPPLPLYCYKVLNLDSIQDEGKPVTKNTHEGLFVACLVYTLVTRARLEHSKVPVRVGVITPYKNQKLLIENKIEDRLSRLPAKEKQKIILDVNTIDGFQGQERDVIIMSCVRSRDIGFLSDKQRLCLALTRAKHSLILCGNFETFRSNREWNELLTDAQCRGLYANVKWNISADEMKTYIVQ